MTEALACNNCVFAESSGREKQFICVSPVYPRGKNIYEETFNVLKHVGCATGMRK
jgi:hypothetical protein